MTDGRLTTVDGFDLAVQVTGPDDGPALLLLPGQANSHAWWDDLRGSFADHFRVLTYDYRGTGGSRGSVGPWSTTSFADDAAQVLRDLAISSAFVYGTSMGGRVAQMLAAEHPTLVRRLVLACTSPGGRHAQERSAETRRALADPDPDRRRRALLRLFYTDDWLAGPHASNLLGDPTMTPAETRAHLRASSRHDAWDVLPGIEAPTMVLHGTADLMVPAANAPLLAARVPDATLYFHPGGRHGFFDEFQTTVTPLVRSFLLS